MEDVWSLKKLHKRIVMSGVYRQSFSSSESSAATRAADPDHHTLWQMNAGRREAEVVRDSVLTPGGSLDLTMGGPPVEHTRRQTVLRRSLYFRQDKERQITFSACSTEPRSTNATHEKRGSLRNRRSRCSTARLPPDRLERSRKVTAHLMTAS
jgi:hypothetical protein